MAQFYSPKRHSANKPQGGRQAVTLAIDTLDQFGQGVGRLNGKTLFIQGALPGEQVEAVLTDDKRQYAKGKLKKLLSNSTGRIVPRCPHFGICGGCQLQHAASELQQKSKTDSLLHLILRETGLKVEADSVISGMGYGYRRRARLGLQFIAKQQRLVMGFRQNGSNDLVEIEHCPVLKPPLEALILPLRHCLSKLNIAKRLGHAELVLADNGPILVLRHLSPIMEEDRRALVAFAKEWQTGVTLVGNDGVSEMLCGEPSWYCIDNLKLTFDPRDFIQVNDEINHLMVAQALEWLDLQPEDSVLDLFCGMGNFTLPIAKRVKQAIGIEGVPSLVEQGQNNARNNSLDNALFYHENLEEDVRNQPWAKQGFNKILLDPARAGAAGVMSQIIKLAPERIVYISCNPTTLARDSKALLAAHYHLEHVRMLDMFPQTAHLESMALFVKQATATAAK